MKSHIRARWNFAYTVAAFAAIGFVYVSAAYLLHPVHGVTAAMRNALDLAGLLLFSIACAHHLPPLLATSRPRLAVACGIVASIVLGVTLGGFLAVDAIFAEVRYPAIALASWAVLILVVLAAMLSFSGLSPETRFALYARRRRRARQRHARI